VKRLSENAIMKASEGFYLFIWREVDKEEKGSQACYFTDK